MQKLKKSKPTGTRFLDKYTNRKKLGRGAFGDVFLVEDDDGKLMALKLIDRKKVEAKSGEDDDMMEYLEGEIECMQSMNEKNIVKLYSYEKDEDYYYMLMEYCDGGDLVNLQATYKNKVFPLEDAIQTMVDVIKGLEQLHKAGYLHRDIKTQNVLLKN